MTGKEGRIQLDAEFGRPQKQGALTTMYDGPEDLPG